MPFPLSMIKIELNHTEQCAPHFKWPSRKWIWYIEPELFLGRYCRHRTATENNRLRGSGRKKPLQMEWKRKRRGNVIYDFAILCTVCTVHSRQSSREKRYILRLPGSRHPGAKRKSIGVFLIYFIPKKSFNDMSKMKVRRDPRPLTSYVRFRVTLCRCAVSVANGSIELSSIYLLRDYARARETMEWKPAGISLNGWLNDKVNVVFSANSRVPPPSIADGQKTPPLGRLSSSCRLPFLSRSQSQKWCCHHLHCDAAQNETFKEMTMQW